VKATKRRKLAGDIVRDEIAHQGQTQDWAAERMGMSSSALHSVLNGEVGVTQMKLRSVAGTLGLPRRLLTSVVDGDAAHIRAIGDDEMQPTLRRAVLRGLTRIEAEGPTNDYDLAF
jgi:transcriptional regulator with XRE-family HTH domain